ncbi:MAG: hypothetical protein SVV80_04650 [Planctomycetota bacterium]|nr:hypothetical protein [Planctomycetota bacterium]
MPAGNSRFKWVLTLVRIWSFITLALLGVGFVATLAYAGFSIAGEFVIDLLPIWILTLLAIVSAAGLVLVFRGLVEAVVSNERDVKPLADHLKRIESLLEAAHESNRRLVELSQMSDAARSLLFRRHEIEAMNELLHEHLIGQDYTGAEKLVTDIEKRFGHTEQVEQMRKEIIRAGATTAEQKVDAALGRIGKLIESRDWAGALRQTKRLVQLLPDNPRIAALPQLISDARTKHKRDLLGDYDQAVKSGDIDRSVELLRELDKYLTPQEAAAMEESARGVFKAKLHNFGVQFAVRVTDQDWSGAIAIGQQIIGEYPNSRMAQEVRRKMATMQELAVAKKEATEAK